MKHLITTYSFIPKEKFINHFYTLENFKNVLLNDTSIFNNRALSFISKTIKSDLPFYIPLTESVVSSLNKSIIDDYDIIKLYMNEITEFSNWCLIFIIDWGLSEWGTDTRNSIYPTYNKLLKHRIILQYS